MSIYYNMGQDTAPTPVFDRETLAPAPPTRRMRVTVFDPSLGASTERRTNPRVRQICDEYLLESTLALPRVTLEGAPTAERIREDLAPNSAGLIICQNIVCGRGDWSTLFEACSRALAPGGILYISAPDAQRFMDPVYNLPGLSSLPAWMAEMFLALTFNYGMPLHRAIHRKEVFDLEGQFEVFEYSNRTIGNGLSPREGFLEFSCIKRFQ